MPNLPDPKTETSANAALAIGTRLATKGGEAARIVSWDASDYVTIRVVGDGWSAVFGLSAAYFWRQVSEGIWIVKDRNA